MLSSHLDVVGSETFLDVFVVNKVSHVIVVLFRGQRAAGRCGCSKSKLGLALTRACAMLSWCFLCMQKHALFCDIIQLDYADDSLACC